MAETYRYPYVGITSTETDYFEIEIYTVGSEQNNSNSLTDVAPIGTRVGTIILPMPSNIQDGNSVAYGEETLSNFTAKGLDIAESAMTADILKDGLSSLDNTFQKAGKLIDNAGLRDIVIKSLAAEAVSIFGGNVSVNSILARQSGQIINPNMELLFSGVTLRTFRFSFKMTPRNKKESEQIKQIIKTLKKNMAPGGQRGDDFLTTPKIFQPQYMKGTRPHPFLHKFKTCFLKDMSVNYTGENTYATYSDGIPISMTMDLTFQEREPIYESDYDKSGTTVGY
jgi:hypothetical protein